MERELAKVRCGVEDFRLSVTRLGQRFFVHLENDGACETLTLSDGLNETLVLKDALTLLRALVAQAETDPSAV